MLSRLRHLMIAAAVLAAAPEARCADPLEGDWRINGEGALVRIEASGTPGGSLDILWLSGPDMDIAPLTPIGTATPGAEPGVYDCSVKRSLKGGKKNASMVIRLHGADALSFEGYRRHARLSLWRLVPYLFRVSVITSSDRPSGLDGARRLGAPPAFIVI